MTEQLPLGWKDIDRATDLLLEWVGRQMAKRPPISAVTGIPRGGLIPAVMLSHRLGIPYAPIADTCGSDRLVVDDIVDTGETMRFWAETSALCCALTMRSDIEMDGVFAPIRIRRGLWVVFPWEDSDPVAIAEDRARYAASR